MDFNTTGKKFDLENNLASFPKILIICLSSIGDVLHSTTVAHALKKAFPALKISWVVEGKSQDVILGNSDLERVFVWDRRVWYNEAKKTGAYWQLIKRNLKFFREIRKQNFAIVINLHGFARADLFAFISGTKYRICLPDPHDKCLSTNIPTPGKKFANVYERLLSVLTHFGIENATPVMNMTLSAENEAFARNFMAEHQLKPQQFIIFNPSASSANKRWPPDKFALLGDLLNAEFELPIVISGALADKHLAQAIAAQMSAPVIDATGITTLRELGALAAQARVFISGDTGPLYIAHAVKTPAVALYGPTSAAYYHLSGQGKIALQAQDGSLNNLSVQEVLRTVGLVLRPQ
jgi:ADP-heptose:LPS heptosyltransferase